MGLEISRLSESLVAPIKRTHIGAVPCVDTNMCTKVEVQGEPLATPLKSTLTRRENNNYSTRQGKEGGEKIF